ncbi:hypothetical protein F3157_05435 [Virgibacillus dakarensis]|nr:hypothetical protein [Virgibacillus dakarensis]
MKHVKYHPAECGLPEGKDKDGNTIVARGAWGEWLAEIDIKADMAQRIIKVVAELGDNPVSGRFSDLGIKALYEIAQLPPEQREVEHEVNGKTKKPEDMTVRELREVKEELKKREQRISELTSKLQAKDSTITQAEARAQAEQMERVYPGFDLRNFAGNFSE